MKIDKIFNMFYKRVINEYMKSVYIFLWGKENKKYSDILFFLFGR